MTLLLIGLREEQRTKVQAAASVLPNDMLKTCYAEPKLLGMFNFWVWAVWIAHFFTSYWHTLRWLFWYIPSECARIFFYHFSRTKMHRQRWRVMYQNLIDYDLALLFISSIFLSLILPTYVALPQYRMRAEENLNCISYVVLPPLSLSVFQYAFWTCVQKNVFSSFKILICLMNK